MKYLKLFESHSEIESICRKFDISNWKLNPDGTVDVDGDVDISDSGIKKIPLKFGSVSGNFDCSHNELNGLEGAPRYVGGNFWCHVNELMTLQGGPKEVGVGFYCYSNRLITLEGSPREVGRVFFCSNNRLITLEGGPKEIGGDFLCKYNPIWEVCKLFPDWKSYLDSMDYDYLRGTSIIKWKFQEALDEVGIDLPESIPGYKYI